MLILSSFYRANNLPGIIGRWWHQNSNSYSPVLSPTLLTTAFVCVANREKGISITRLEHDFSEIEQLIEDNAPQES